MILYVRFHAVTTAKMDNRWIYTKGGETYLIKSINPITNELNCIPVPLEEYKSPVLCELDWSKVGVFTLPRFNEDDLTFLTRINPNDVAGKALCIISGVRTCENIIVQISKQWLLVDN
jgi:hypothetical protein